MGKDGWTHDSVGNVSCSFTSEQEIFGRLEGFECEEKKWGKKGGIIKTWEEIKN